MCSDYSSKRDLEQWNSLFIRLKLRLQDGKKSTYTTTGFKNILRWKNVFAQSQNIELVKKKQLFENFLALSFMPSTNT